MKIVKNFVQIQQWAALKKKSFLMAVFLVAMTFVGVQGVFASGAHEYENPPCFDITGKTKEVLIQGVNNGGIMDFDDTGGVEKQYQACVRVKEDGGRLVPDHLEGWVWNDNLGWVSMYCKDGKNLGIDCGSIDYKVTFNANGNGTDPADFASVKMYGYAWGDNVGYISFQSGHHQMSPTASGNTRGVIPDAPPAARYAWTDSVGWLDFSGVKFPWKAAEVPSQEPDVEILDIKNNDLLKNSGDFTPPVADNEQKYTININFNDEGTDINGKVEPCPNGPVSMYAQSTSGKDYCAKVDLQWHDSVDLDQTTVDSQNANENDGKGPYCNLSSPGGNNAVTKPLKFVVDLSGGSTLSGEVKSYAPTSDGNKADGIQLETFIYVKDNDVDNGYNMKVGNQNMLKIKSLQLMLFKYSSDGKNPGKCILGEISHSSLGVATCNLHEYYRDVSLPFKPLIAVNKLVHEVGNGKELNFINIENVDNEQNFPYSIEKNSEKDFTTGTLETKFRLGLKDQNYDFCFVKKCKKDGGDGGELSVAELKNDTLKAKLISINESAYLSPQAGPYLFSKVSYTLDGKDIAYFSNKLPRVKAGLLINPVALVQGNVYLTNYAAKASDMSLRSLGNVSSNLRREQIYKNVQRYLRGKSVTNFDRDVTVGVDVSGNLIGTEGLMTLVKDKIFYLRDKDLTIDCGNRCEFSDDVTFIVENGNIFVKSDIVPNPGKHIGLIALRNLKKDKMNQGFVNIHSNVKWLSRVHIYADRLLQSYDRSLSGVGFNNQGFFVFDGDDFDRQKAFKNQIVFEGTLSSMNGIGNAIGTHPTNDLGEVIENSNCTNYSNLEGICRARAVDLNYLRYYGPGLEICDGNEGTGAVAGVPKDQQRRGELDGGCDPNAEGYSIDATTLDSENGDLVAGGVLGGEKSEYFNGKEPSMKNEFPVNFFYVAIPDNFGGFEKDQEYNPVIH